MEVVEFQYLFKGPKLEPWSDDLTIGKTYIQTDSGYHGGVFILDDSNEEVYLDKFRLEYFEEVVDEN